jgi:hypothetical protein
LRQLAHDYEAIINLKAFLVGFLLIRVALCYKLNSRFEIVITSFERTIPMVAVFSVYIMPLILMIAFVGMYWLGPTNINYSSFGASIISIFLCAVGLTNNEFKDVSFRGGIFVILVVFFVYMLIINLFYSIYCESYRTTMLDYGHDFHSESSWKTDRK